MEYTTPTIGFGFDPKDCMQHFLVVIPKNSDDDVTVYERYKWDNADEQTSELPSDKNSVVRCKVSISRARWNEVKPDLERVLNAELKKEKKSAGHFIIGQTPVEKLLAREMMVLLWAVESCDKNIIKKDAIRNWEGLCREERWWLYTMTNSTTGDSESKRGWRSALRFAITNNPDDDTFKVMRSLKSEIAPIPVLNDSTKTRDKCIGFGYEPAECLQHFMVVNTKPRSNKCGEVPPYFVSVYERFTWDDGLKQYSQLPEKNEANNDVRCKVSISNEKWDLVFPVIEEVFNTTLKKSKRNIYHFKGHTQVPVERLLGKEMMVLLWAIEDCDISVVPTAIRNWQALSREERWWLFTMTNATTGEAENKRGWRIALKYALTDNPVVEKNDQAYLNLWGELFSSSN